MAKNFNIQKAASRRLSGEKGTPTTPYRPYGEVSQGVPRGSSGRHWSGERQMARENAMSRKWAQYKRSGRG